MAYRHLSLPSEVDPAKGLRIGHRSLSSVTPQYAGTTFKRSYWPRQKLTYSLETLTGYDETQELAELRAMHQFLDGEAGRIWVRHPLSQFWRKVKAFPSGDGSTTAFVIPFHEHGGTPYLYKDEGSGQRHVNLSYYTDRANLIVDDDEAALIEGSGSLAGVNLGGGSISRTDLHAYYGTHSLQVSPSGSQTDYGAETSIQTSDIAAARTYTAGAWVKSSVTKNYKARVYWYDSGGSPCSPAYTDGSGIAGAWDWTCIYASVTASTSAAQAKVRIYLNDTDSASFWVDCFFLTDLEEPWFWLPSMAPGVGVVASAPAASAIMEAAGTGYRITPMTMESDEWQDVIDGLGNQASRVELIEDWSEWA